MRLIETTEAKPLRIFTHVSEFDNRPRTSKRPTNWVMANRHRGGTARQGATIGSPAVTPDTATEGIQHTLADTLVWMWRGYPRQPSKGRGTHQRCLAGEYLYRFFGLRPGTPQRFDSWCEMPSWTACAAEPAFAAALVCRAGVCVSDPTRLTVFFWRGLRDRMDSTALGRLRGSKITGIPRNQKPFASDLPDTSRAGRKTGHAADKQAKGGRDLSDLSGVIEF